MTAILLVDMLNEFMTGKLRCDGAQGVIPNIKALLPAARARGYPVVFTNDAHRPEGDREFEIWSPHAIADKLNSIAIMVATGVTVGGLLDLMLTRAGY
jgi:nicotinamidase-related amidase